MGESLIRMPHSEVTATLERLSALGVEPDDLRHLRKTGADGRFRAEIIARQLGIKHASFLTPPNGSHDKEELAARWKLIDEKLLEAANGIPRVKKTSNPFRAFELIVDHCYQSYGYEFLVWQVVCEMMYQISMGGSSETSERVRRVISSMEYRSEFMIGCHRFQDILPEEHRAHHFMVIPRSENNCNGIKEALWPRMRMRTLQLIVRRYIYLMA